MNEKVAVLTGGTSGIGFETAAGLLRLGFRVISTARDMAVAEKIRTELIARTGNSNIGFLACDLASFESISLFSEKVAVSCRAVNILINNAGVLPQKREESRDGIELNFAVNFLAPFLLTHLLLPLLRKETPARIINVSSSMHQEATINFEDIESKKHFDKYKAYGQSKLAVLLFTRLLSKKLSGTGITANAVHPGVVGTEMTMQNVDRMNPILRFFYKKKLLTAEQGAETSLSVATSPDIANISGEYFFNKKIIHTSPESYDLRVAEKLCSVAEEYIQRKSKISY